MRKTSKIILVTIIATSILLGLGYAAIQNITLNISGTAAANPNQENFKVRFTGIHDVSDSTYVTAGITNDTNATINVSGLNTKGQKVTAVYDITNESSDLSSDLYVEVSNTNSEYFTITSKLAKTSLVAGETTTVTVTVELTKVLISNTVSADIGVYLAATPVEPGKEGSSGITDDFAQFPVGTLDLVTNENIGEYIDLGNSFIGTESTSDDWRILYKDENKVYVMLADFLPIKYVDPDINLQMDVENQEFNIWKEDSTTTDLSEELLKSDNWIYLANEIDGAEVRGAATPELILQSYNYVNDEKEEYTNFPTFKSDSLKRDLYAPNSVMGNDEGMYGYWLAKSIVETESIGLSGTRTVYKTFAVIQGGYIGTQWSAIGGLGIRPVIELPISTTAEFNNGIWKVIKLR